MIKKLLVAAASLGVLALGTPSFAHHSFAAQYDGNKPVRLTGTLVKIEWTNPHSYIHLAVTSKKDGTVSEWACEGANPGALSRRGFKRGDIKLGDTLTIDGFLAKNGSHLIDARRITLASGRVIYGGSAGDGGPGDTGAEN
jgi:hypothetical protein